MMGHRIALLPLALAAACASAQPAAAPDLAVATDPARTGRAQQAVPLEYRLGAGDAIKIQVFENQNLTLETRVSEAGTITYPLIGSVNVGGLSVSKAEALIARLLGDGGYVIEPQVTILVQQIRGNEVSALGQFNRPGRFPLETTQTHLSDVMAQAGGVAPNGADFVIVTGVRDGVAFRREIDVNAMYQSPDTSADLLLQAGDVVYVQRAPQVYIYGEVQRPGMFRLERDMTVMQALAEGGGLTLRGTQRHVRVHRRGADGAVLVIEPRLDDRLQPDDVVYVQERLF